jgi:hypothetical protein
VNDTIDPKGQTEKPKEIQETNMERRTETDNEIERKRESKR